MFNKFKIAVIANVILAGLFFYSNWADYEFLNLSENIVRSDWPSYIYSELSSNSPGIHIIVLLNFSLLLFCIIVVVNLYFLWRINKDLKKALASGKEIE